MNKILTKKAVREFQKSWSEGLIEIGKAYSNQQNYQQIAEEFLYRFYGYEEGIVLFKPTLASIEQFRDTAEKALSYFIAGNENYPEDQGFALRPWAEVRYKNEGIILMHKRAVAMGNYFFTDYNDVTVKVEYTFGYFLTKEGETKIQLHHSSMPFISK